MYGNWEFARIQGIGWGWAGVIWLYSIVFYIPLDIFKFAIRYALTGKAWNNMIQNRVIVSSFSPFLYSMMKSKYNVTLLN